MKVLTCVIAVLCFVTLVSFGQQAEVDEIDKEIVVKDTEKTLAELYDERAIIDEEIRRIHERHANVKTNEEARRLSERHTELASRSKEISKETLARSNNIRAMIKKADAKSMTGDLHGALKIWEAAQALLQGVNDPRLQNKLERKICLTYIEIGLSRIDATRRSENWTPREKAELYSVLAQMTERRVQSLKKYGQQLQGEMKKQVVPTHQ